MNIGELIDKFREVGLDRIEVMNEALLTLERAPAEAAAHEQLLREIHTLKGESKMLGFADVNLVAHQIESVMMLASERAWRVPRHAVDLLFEGLDTLRILLTKRVGAADSPVDLSGFVDRVHRVVELLEQLHDDARPDSSADAAAGSPWGLTPGSPADCPPGSTSEATLEATSQAELYEELGQEVSQAAQVAQVSRQAGGLQLQTEHTLRVRFEKLERLGEAASEVMLMGRRLDYHHKQLELARDHLKGWIALAEANLPKSHLASIRALSHRLDAIAQAAREDSHLVNLRTGQLDEEVRSLRHVPLAQVTSHYPRAVRDLAHSQGKRVRFVQEVGNIEIDRVILSSLSDPLLHLIRNAVDHGVEPPHERLSAGKPPEAEIVLSVQHQGDGLVVLLRDDGRGIDLERVRHKAVARGVLSADAARAMTDQEAIALIFEAGLSTRDDVSDISGRGLGMDIVLRQVTQLGGIVDVESHLGQGTSFRLYLPTSSVVSVVLLLRLGGRVFGVHAQDIERVTRRKAERLIKLHDATLMREEQDLIPVLDWRPALGLRPQARGPQEDVQLLLIRKGSRRVAVRVDEVLGEREAVTRPLGEFLQGARLCRGVALTDADEIVPLLNVVELLSRAAQEEPRLTQTWREGRELTSPRAQAISTLELRALPGRSQQRAVLLAEDSEITRSLIAKIVRSLGHRVLEAEDGKMAWDMLQDHRVDLLITDIQMPRRSGLELLELLRASPSLRHTPTIVLSTLGSAQDKEQAMSRGANTYLVKLDFREKELISAVQRYLGAG